MPEPVLSARDFNVRFATADGEVHAVRSVSFDIAEGECLGVVGESGSGKSQLFLGAVGLLASNGVAEGKMTYRGRDLTALSQARLNSIRGSGITMIFQDPLTSLTPHMRIGDQIIESLRVHHKMKGDEARKRAIESLELVRIPEAKRRLRQYPHELSGGMRQRVMIAMATACGPDLLIADEPTTALDVTVQAQILEIMRDLKDELKTAIVLISHDMGVIAAMADRVEVMREGEFVESGSIDDIFYAPQHDYTRMLLDSMPRVDQPDRPGHENLQPLGAPERHPNLLEVESLSVHFPIRVEGWIPRYKPLRAVDGVSFSLREGETLGVVGESGCGKSTLARAVLALLPATAGVVLWSGSNLGEADKEAIRKLRKELQIVFQDPLASLDPRMTIGQSIGEPVRALEPGLERSVVTGRVREVLEQVGLDPAWINRYPHEFSGGQNQRVGIARAMIVKPRLVICDEAVSALDVSVQAQVIDLILSLQKAFGMSMIFISHDLSVVRQVSHRVMVLYLGRVVELAGRNDIYEDPRHPYTRALISAVPIPDPRKERAKERIPLPDELPSPLDTRAALTFLKSKRVDDPEAEQYLPRLVEVSPGHFVAEHDPV
ncbi:MAG TPA: ABC transporter ATP-binding protein [Gammaproteobacteria bacterium]|jgi:oligopeptide/dipeptide ABC transporter ATP-binding protein